MSDPVCNFLLMISRQDGTDVKLLSQALPQMELTATALRGTTVEYNGESVSIELLKIADNASQRAS